MTMARHEFTVTDDAGNIVPSVTIEVRSETAGAPLAALKSDRAGIAGITNPFTTGSDGIAAFHVAGGAYKIRAYLGPDLSPTFERIQRYVGIGLLSESDGADSLNSARITARVATTANITIATALNNGDVLNGVTLATDDIVLVKDQTAPAENGVYVVGASPARHTNFSTYNNHVGAFISVTAGSANPNSLWFCAANVGGVLGTDPIVFSRVAVTAEQSSVGAISIPYTFSTTTTDSDPGTGMLRLDNATQGSATVIRTDLLDNLGIDRTAILDTLDASTSTIKGQVRLYKVSDPDGAWITFDLSARATPSGYRNFTVAYTSKSGVNPLANGDAIVMVFTRTGDKGTTGSVSGTSDLTVTGAAKTDSNRGRSTLVDTSTSNWGYSAVLGNVNYGTYPSDYTDFRAKVRASVAGVGTLQHAGDATYLIAGVYGWVPTGGHGSQAVAGMFDRPDGAGNTNTHPYAVMFAGGVPGGGFTASRAMVVYDFTADKELYYINGDGTPFAGGAMVASNMLNGLVLFVAGSTGTFGVGSGSAADSTNGYLMNLSNTFSKTTSAWAVGTGNGAMDTGAVANNTWYHVFLIKRLDTGLVDVLFSLSPTAPTMPANYVVKRRIGSMKTDGSAQWKKFVQLGDHFLWDVPVQDQNAVVLGASALYTLASVPTGITVQAWISSILTSTSAAAAATLSSPLITAPAVGTPSANQDLQNQVANQVAVVVEYIFTNTSAQIRAVSNGAGTIAWNVATRGWVDLRGK